MLEPELHVEKESLRAHAIYGREGAKREAVGSFPRVINSHGDGWQILLALRRGNVASLEPRTTADECFGQEVGGRQLKEHDRRAEDENEHLNAGAGNQGQER